MSQFEVLLTDQANSDLDDIVRYGEENHSQRQVENYVGLVAQAIDILRQEPYYPATRSRDEHGAKVRSFHIRLAARRKSSGRHIIYYMPVTGGVDKEPILLILRVLHERADPAEHIKKGLESAWAELRKRFRRE